MQKIFREEGLPPELAYLPLVESSFNIRARSSVGAVGMWQFMLETGKKFLRIDEDVDERLDPMAATRAAARLLKENYRILGRWPLAITAYNHGTDGIFRGVQAVESDNLVDLIRGYQSPTFGFASKNFYAEFLAVVDIVTNRERYFPDLRIHRPVNLQEVAVKRSAKLQALLKPAAISQRDFFEWNPALDPTAQSIPVGYRVRLPPDKVDDFLAAHKRADAAPQAKKPSVVRIAALQKAAVRSQRQAAATIARTPRMALAAANATGKTSSPVTKRATASRAHLKLAAR
jgi:membrane-bound lytic murein transglycosylase D